MHFQKAHKQVVDPVVDGLPALAPVDTLENANSRNAPRLPVGNPRRAVYGFGMLWIEDEHPGQAGPIIFGD